MYILRIILFEKSKVQLYIILSKIILQTDIILHIF